MGATAEVVIPWSTSYPITYNDPGLTTFGIKMNNQRGHTKDINLRKAICYAFDYDSFINQILKGRVARNMGPIPNTMWGSPKDLEGYTYDLKKAEAELKKASVKIDRPLNIHPMTGYAQTDDAALILQLVARGATVDAVDRLGLTPLFHASAAGKINSVGALLDAGADINRTGGPNQATALMAAAGAGKTAAAKLLLERGAKTDIQDEMHGSTALIWAAGREHADIVKALLAHGANPDIVDKAGRTALTTLAAGHACSPGAVIW